MESAVFKGPPTDCGRRWLDMKRRTKEMRPVATVIIIHDINNKTTND